MNRFVALPLALFALVVSASANKADDAQITIASGGAAKSALGAVLPAFEKTSGLKVSVDYAPMGALIKRLESGDLPDIVVLTKEVMDAVEGHGWVDRATIAEIGRTGIGVAVHENAPAPDISTAEAFKKALLAAKSIVYIDPNRGTSGKHFAQVLVDLGIADEINKKATLLAGGYVVEPVGRGEIELGVHQITEILPVKGVKLVGPLPAPLQKETIYIGAVTTKARDVQAARRVLAYLSGPDVVSTYAARGFTRP